MKPGSTAFQRLAALVGLVTCASVAQESQDATTRAPPVKPALPTVAECPGMKVAEVDTSFPRDAARRGIDKGVAVVVFTVTEDRTDIVGVDATDRAFSAPAVQTVRSFRCRTNESRTFAISLTFIRQ